MIRYSIAIILLFITLTSFGQARKLIRKGNNEFEKKQYNQALLSYKQSLASVEDSSMVAGAIYNIGNTMYMQKKYKEAIGAYQQSYVHAKNAEEQARVFHNAGNALFKMKSYKESIEAYKMAL